MIWNHTRWEQKYVWLIFHSDLKKFLMFASQRVSPGLTLLMPKQHLFFCVMCEHGTFVQMCRMRKIGELQWKGRFTYNTDLNLGLTKTLNRCCMKKGNNISFQTSFIRKTRMWSNYCKYYVSSCTFHDLSKLNVQWMALKCVQFKPKQVNVGTFY